MSNIPEIPKQKQNQYLFGAVGAVLGGIMGLGIAGPVAAVVGLGLQSGNASVGVADMTSSPLRMTCATCRS